MTAIRRQTAFAGLDPPEVWPRPPRAAQPERLELGLDTLPGVGPTIQRKLAKLGLTSRTQAALFAVEHHLDRPA